MAIKVNVESRDTKDLYFNDLSIGSVFCSAEYVSGNMYIPHIKTKSDGSTSITSGMTYTIFNNFRVQEFDAELILKHKRG